MADSEEVLGRIRAREREDGGLDAEGERVKRKRLAILLLVLVIGGGAALWWATGTLTLAGQMVDVGGGDQMPLLDRVRALLLEQREADLRPPSDDSSSVEFEVYPGESLPEVASRLEAAGLVRDADAFRLLAQVRGLDRQVQAGPHRLRRDMSASEVLNALLVSEPDTVTVTLPEGLRAEEVADRLDAAGVAERAEFLRLVGAGAVERPATADRPAGTGLEGYLFPDTYVFEYAAGAEAALERLIETFDARVTPDMRARAAASDLSIYEVVTLASIVERETALDAERPMVARVYLNRLETPPYLLNADPTVQYAVGYQRASESWWKRPLTTADLESDSAYNTYTTPGLPPGPIASPGLASIEAVLWPADGNWQYFVADGDACDGSHVFAVTYDEHLANVARYRAAGACGG